MIRAKLVSLLQHRLAVPALLLFLLAITFALYFPGLFGDFIFDDYVNIVTNDDAHLQQLTLAELMKVISSGMASVLTRPLAMLSFGINYYLTGLNPFFFKLTNVLIHLALSVGVYLLSFELLKVALKPQDEDLRRMKMLALVVAACWAVHPLNVSTTLYIVQRMTQLAALTTVFTLVYYCRFRQRADCSRSQAVTALCVLGVLTVFGVLFKENAILVVLFILCIEFFLLRFQATNEGHRLFLKLFLTLMVVLPGLGAVAILLVSPDSIIGGYEVRSFTLGERLLTEARVIWLYIKWLLMPDLRELVFFYDNYPPSRSLIAPISTLVSVIGMAGLILFCFLARKRFPVLAFGVAFFLAGHAMESTIIPLELVFEHRNYLPGFGILLALVYGLMHASFVLRKQTAAIILAVYLLFLAHGTFEEARKWSSTYEHLSTIVRQSPDSHRINYSMGYFLLSLAATIPENSELLDVAGHYFAEAVELDDGSIRSHVGLILADSQNNKATDPRVVNELFERIRTTPRITNYTNDIGGLIECRFSGFCQFDAEILLGIYNAIATNRNSSPIAVQGILAQTAIEMVVTFGRTEDGKALLYLARGVRPDELTVIDLDLIKMELESGNKAQARTVLAEANTKAGNGGSFADELEELKLMLEEQDDAE